MRDFLNQIRASLDSNLYYVALFASLAVPDICGAIGSDNGQASKKKYIEWFDRYVAPKYRSPHEQILTGEDCYFFRCSMLHQGSSQHPNSSYARVLFIEPGATRSVAHRCVFIGALVIDVRIFCKDIVSSAYNWLEEVSGTERFEENFNKFMRRYPQGLAPYVIGVPVIS
jgi:hypothetical protein